MTNIEIIKEWKSHTLVPPHLAMDIVELMDKARKDEAEEILTWFIKYMLLESRDKYNSEELYQLFKQSKP